MKWGNRVDGMEYGITEIVDLESISFRGNPEQRPEEARAQTM
jgi:hypothetical protein